ncbi:MarC family protein [Candidatus Methanarcanum hacksteinii]|uniref:MarC family protein n=1 Tax=Candidatus Methanarcanum hacksteinii TaxID=2911857 RepID=UPI0037DC604E
MDPSAIITLSISLFLILDPFASVPMFINITNGLDNRTIKTYADKAIVVAAILLFMFILIGDKLMDIFGVTMDSFRVAGGIIFLMMAVELVFGLKLSKIDDQKGAKWAIIASPILTGPGVITTAILISSKYGIATVMVASTIALVTTWVILRESDLIMRLVGEQALSILTKIIGLFIAAMGVESIFSGSLGWFDSHMAAEAIMQMLMLV